MVTELHMPTMVYDPGRRIGGVAGIGGKYSFAILGAIIFIYSSSYVYLLNQVNSTNPKIIDVEGMEIFEENSLEAIFTQVSTTFLLLPSHSQVATIWTL